MKQKKISDFEYWTQDIRNDGVPFPLFCDLFGDDEIAQGEAIEICRKSGIGLRYWSDEMPEEMLENDEALEEKHLSQIGRPEWHGQDGWEMVGAFDTEDGEICLMYARPIKIEEISS